MLSFESLRTSAGQSLTAEQDAMIVVSIEDANILALAALHCGSHEKQLDSETNAATCIRCHLPMMLEAKIATVPSLFYLMSSVAS